MRNDVIDFNFYKKFKIIIPFFLTKKELRAKTSRVSRRRTLTPKLHDLIAQEISSHATKK